MKRWNLRRSIALLVFPAMLLVVSERLREEHGPYALGRNSDPDYIYLFNPLNILMLRAPSHVDHPGATLQEIGAAVLFCKWLPSALFGNPLPLERSVLANPEGYLRVMSRVLTALIAAVFAFAGLRLYRSSGSLAAALLFQATPCLFREILISLHRVAPEPLLITAGVLFMVPFFDLLIGKHPVKPIVAGATLGLGVVTKLTFIPLGLFIALFKVPKDRWRFALAAIGAAAIFIFPIREKLPYLFNWSLGILTHNGVYGTGSVGLPTLAQVLNNLQSLFAAEPFILCWLTYYLLVLVTLEWIWRTDSDSLAFSVKRACLVGSIVIVVQIAMAVKHYVDSRYVLPCLLVCALLNALLFLLLSNPAFPKTPRLLLAVLGVVLIAANTSSTFLKLRQWTAETREYRREVEKLAQWRASRPDCLTVGYYGSSVPGYALAFGSGYSAGLHIPTLTSLYSDFVWYNMFSGSFFSLSVESRNDYIATLLSQGRCVLLQGWPLSAADAALLPPGQSLTPLAGGFKEVLYRLRLKDGPP